MNRESGMIKIFLAGILGSFFIGACSLKSCYTDSEQKSSTTGKPPLSLQGAEALKSLSSFAF